MTIQPSDYETIVLPVDDLEWTRHWLDTRRCDLLLVEIARRPGLTPLVHINALESKSTDALAAVDVRDDEAPFDEAIGQVTETLDALWGLISMSGADHLVEDLKYSVFCQHLASVALAKLHPIGDGDTEAVHVLRTISMLAARQIEKDVTLDGTVVLTQYKASIPQRIERVVASGVARDWEVTLVRAGAKELGQLLGTAPSPTGLPDPAGTPTPATKIAPGSAEGFRGRPESESAGGAPAVAWSDTGGDDGQQSSGLETATAAGLTQPLGGATEGVLAQGATVGSREASDVRASASDATREIATDLYLACRNRQFPVSEPDPEHLVVGASVIVVPMMLAPGGQLRPIEAALADLARELGVPGISVENDPERAYFIRFLIGRTDRVFPGLPTEPAPFVTDDAYLGLYLGQTISGADHVSFVSQWPHLLVAGTTGSGKTTFLRSLLEQVGHHDQAAVRVAVVDGKGETDFIGAVPASHFVPEFPDVVPGADGALRVLEWIVDVEMVRRREIINRLVRENPTGPRNAKGILLSGLPARTEPFPVLLCVIDEFSQLMLTGGASADQFESMVQQVSQVGRSLLVHLLLATQRPDVSVIKGAVKANLNAHLALRLPSIADSMTILGGKGAERLLGRGDLLFQTTGDPPVRLQGYSV